MTTTTDHIKALLVDDGREFAMIRKTDLEALMHVANAYPDGSFVDLIGGHKAEIKRLELEGEGFRKLRSKSDLIALKHGEERRRYMANNKALQARVDMLEYAAVGMQEHWEAQRSDMFRYIDHIMEGIERESRLEARLLRVARFKRKFPTLGVLMDMTP